MADFVLEVVEGPDTGLVVPLDGALEIGRDPGVELSLADQLASRRHARISPAEDGAVLEDLGSTNGTFVNETEIGEPILLAPGDELLIGNSRIRLGHAVDEERPQPVPDAPPLADASPPLAPPLADSSSPPAPPLAPPPPGEQRDAPRAMDTLDVAEDPRLGSELAGYRIEALIGRGGMGVVYRAEHLRLGRKVALKLLPPELAENEGFRERFESESRLAAAIDHPNIIPLYEAGEVEGLLFITMRFVDGLDLKALIEREGPLPLERAISIVGQVGGALDAAHERGLVHRDIKPANVLVSSGAGPEAWDHCYLTDFGLTKDTSSSVALTAAGQFVGTIDYVAPEQIQGVAAGGAADQYSLAAVFYECLTGRPPFERQTELDVMWAHLNEEPPRVSEMRRDLPRGVDAVIQRAMAKTPEDRYPNCAGMAAAAHALVSGRRRHRR